MDEKRLIWTEQGRKQVFNSKVFSVWESYCNAPESRPDNEPQPGQKGGGASREEPQVFTIIDARDWVIIVPVIDSPNGKQFIMVWQWRHGSQCLSLEFPGGVMEPGENPDDAAKRELYEETGYKPQKIEKIGEFSPNPAIMSNKVHFFLAENFTGDGEQNLDEDEYVETALVDINEVIQGMGKKPYVHALMGTALALYSQRVP